jgi:hypothetical protein
MKMKVSRGRIFALAAIVASVVVPLAPTPTASAATQLLPDLRMAVLSTIKVDTTTIAGHRLLRYTAEIVDVGNGPFEARGSRPDTSTPTFAVKQRIYDDAGGYVNVPTAATMYWGGDGHNHWHLTDLEGGVLTRLDNGVQVGTSAKEGFHFADNTPFDLSLPNAPQTAQYTSCGGNSCRISALHVTMGLSVGWADIYAASVNFQWIDITDLVNGKYVLTVTADPSHFFEETDNANNDASATIQLSTNGVKVLSYSGGA